MSNTWFQVYIRICKTRLYWCQSLLILLNIGAQIGAKYVAKGTLTVPLECVICSGNCWASLFDIFPTLYFTLCKTSIFAVHDVWFRTLHQLGLSYCRAWCRLCYFDNDFFPLISLNVPATCRATHLCVTAVWWLSSSQTFDTPAYVLWFDSSSNMGIFIKRLKEQNHS